jgi:hypothetical protein
VHAGEEACDDGNQVNNDACNNACEIGIIQPTLSFTNEAGTTAMGMTYDGSRYWSCSGGSSNGDRLVAQSADGGVLFTRALSVDYRSIFTAVAGQGPVLVRGYNSRVIKQLAQDMNSWSDLVTLNGGNLHNQSAVVFDAAEQQYVAIDADVVNRWNAQGVFQDTVALTDASGGRALAVLGGYYYTLSANVISRWNRSGQRLAQFELSLSAGSNYSFSEANGMFWLERSGTRYGFTLPAP